MRRWSIVLTPQEKRALAFVVAVFVIGIATKHYRDSHPRIVATQPARVMAASQPHTSARKPRAPRPSPTTEPESDESED
jgi:hypothetical protein